MGNRAQNVEKELLNMLWVEKYRPTSLEEMVLPEAQRLKFQEFINEGEIPNLLLHGSPGTGKSTLSKILAKSLNCDSIEINGSLMNSIDDVRNTIKPFVSRYTDKDWLIVVIDEADYLSPNAQKGLLNLIEEVSDYARFIFKCNDINKIISAMYSRLQKYNLQSEENKLSLVNRVNHILKEENIDYEAEDLASVFEACYPDIRDIIGTISTNVIDGKLSITSNINSSNVAFINKIGEILDKYKENKVVNKKQVKRDIRDIKKVITNFKIINFNSIFEYLYELMDNDNFIASDDVDTYMELFTIIGDHNMNHVRCVNRELDILALFSKVINVLNKPSK